MDKKSGLIQKNAVLLTIQNYIRNLQMNDNGSDPGILHLSQIYDLIDRLPILVSDCDSGSIEPHYAKWIPLKNFSGYKCSECNARVRNSDVHNGNHKYCYRCGAIMRK